MSYLCKCMTSTQSFCTLFHLRNVLPWLYWSCTLFLCSIHAFKKISKVFFFLEARVSIMATKSWALGIMLLSSTLVADAFLQAPGLMPLRPALARSLLHPASLRTVFSPCFVFAPWLYSALTILFPVPTLRPCFPPPFIAERHPPCALDSSAP